jgi:excisionase family DNA binding protein
MSQKHASSARLSTAAGAAAAAAGVQPRDLELLPLALTVQQVAEFMQVSNAAVYDLIRQKQLLAFKVGNVYRVTRKCLAEFCGLGEADLLSKQQKRRDEVDALLARYRLAQDEVSRVSGRLLELGVLVKEPEPQYAQLRVNGNGW